ncbi:replication-relaxation family protein [Microbacterium lacticum]
MSPNHDRREQQGEAGRERVSARGLLKLGGRLSDRDWQIIRFLGKHRYATTTQLRRVFFTSHASAGAATRGAVRVLDRLLTQRVLSRLERAVGGAGRGSAAYTWRLGHIGERLLQSDPGEPRKRLFEPSPPFLAHALALTELHVGLIEAQARGELILSAVDVERDAWRRYTAPGGNRAVLQPDMTITTITRVTTAADGSGDEEYEDHWYVEVDLGTESLPVLLRKCRAYEAYRRTGRAQIEHGVFPRVLWLMHIPERVARLRSAIAGDDRLTDALFLVTTFDRTLTAVHGPAAVPEPPPGDHAPEPTEQEPRKEVSP